MIQLVHIGPLVVRVENTHLLPLELRGLCRAHAPGEKHEVTLAITQCATPDWALDVSRNGDAHLFGRPRHAVEITPGTRQIRLLLCKGLDFDDVYWLRRDIFGALACLSGGLMLHSSAVQGPDGCGHVFCGPSGTGKSTLARLLQEQGMPVVNDEVNWVFEDERGALNLVNQGYWMDGDECDSLPVGGIYVLQQGAGCQFLPPRSQAELFTSLLSAHLSIDNENDFLKMRAEALAQLVRHHTVKVLEFNLDTPALSALLWNTTNSFNA